MKIFLFIGVLIASVLGQAENRCAVIQNSNGYTIYNTTQGQIGQIQAFSYMDAISKLQKMNTVGACSPLNAGCYIDSSGPTYDLINKYEFSSGTYFRIAVSAGNFDGVISAFDQLVKAGGCQP